MIAANKETVFNQAALSVVFTLSFAIYFASDLSLPLQFAPLLIFAGLVLWKALRSELLVAALAGLFDVDGLLYVIFLSLLMLECSSGSAYEQAFNFAFLLSLFLVLARIYMSLVSVREVFNAFYWSGVLSILLFVPLTFGMLLQSAMTFERLMAFNFHPNLLGLQFAGYFCAMSWKFITGGWFQKVISGTMGIICVIVIFLASSRGSLVGVLAGVVFVAAMALYDAAKRQRGRRVWLIISMFLILPAVFIFVGNSEAVQDTYGALDKMLELSSSARGLDSGMTGRMDIWKEVLRAESDGSWLYGHGVRSSDAAYSGDPKIDNSYLVILYDMGLVPLILITWRFAKVLRNNLRGCFRAVDDSDKKLHLVCAMFLIVFLVIGFVERSLFALGNSFSLLGFLFFTAPNQRFGSQRPEYSQLSTPIPQH